MIFRCFSLSLCVLLFLGGCSSESESEKSDEATEKSVPKVAETPRPKHTSLEIANHVGALLRRRWVVKEMIRGGVAVPADQFKGAIREADFRRPVKLALNYEPESLTFIGAGKGDQTKAQIAEMAAQMKLHRKKRRLMVRAVHVTPVAKDPLLGSLVTGASDSYTVIGAAKE